MNLISVLLMSPSKDASGGMAQILMLVAIVVIFYFFMIRPQTKKAKAEKQFRETLQPGQKVITIGGVHGKVSQVKETTVVLEISNDVRIEVEKTAVAINVNQVEQKK